VWDIWSAPTIHQEKNKMRSTKDRIRKIVRENIQGIAVGPNRGRRFADLAIEAMERQDYNRAANIIMDSFMIDDTYGTEEEGLTLLLKSFGTPILEEELQAIVDHWREQFKAGAYDIRSPGLKEAQLKESVTDMMNLEQMISTAAVDVAQEFNEMMIELVEEDPGMITSIGGSIKSWHEEAYRATMDLEGLIEDAIKKAIETVETQLHNGDYSR
tara:strand:+ start:178 stop:819 length:642 start_codon:yes stop_codon:yes gene_type:complete